MAAERGPIKTAQIERLVADAQEQVAVAMLALGGREDVAVVVNDLSAGPPFPDAESERKRAEQVVLAGGRPMVVTMPRSEAAKMLETSGLPTAPGWIPVVYIHGDDWIMRPANLSMFSKPRKPGHA